jgi:hypothetical protein
MTQYLEFSKQFVLKVEEQKGQQKQTKEDIRMSNMKVWNLLENRNKN